MQSQSPSSAVSIDEMEAVMREIEQGAPAPTPAEVAQIVAPVAHVPAVVEAPAPAPAAQPAANEPEVVKSTGAGGVVREYVKAEIIEQDTQVDPTDFDNACIEQAPKFAYYAQQKAFAKKQYGRLKNAFEIIEAQLYDEYRTKLETEAETEANRRAADESLPKKEREKGAEKITEAMVNAA
jgi:hypothetical protein